MPVGKEYVRERDGQFLKGSGNQVYPLRYPLSSVDKQSRCALANYVGVCPLKCELKEEKTLAVPAPNSVDGSMGGSS